MGTEQKSNTPSQQFDEKGLLQPERNAKLMYALPPDLSPEERSAYLTISRANEQMEQPIHRAKPVDKAKRKAKTSNKMRAKAKGQSPRRRQSSSRRDQPVELTPHQARCSICFHECRDEIEEGFLHWHSPRDIAYDFDVSERAIYRHAHALKLFEQRRRNLAYALGHIIDRVDRIPVMTPESIIRAVQIFARIDDQGQLIEQPKRLIVSQGPRIEAPATAVSDGPASGETFVSNSVASHPQLPAAPVGNRVAHSAPETEEKILVRRAWSDPIVIDSSQLPKYSEAHR